MYEVEVKVRADTARIKTRLSDLGAVFRGTVAQSNSYYDHSSRSFDQTDEALRVRRQHHVNHPTTAGSDPHTAVDGPLLTYNGPRVDADTKTRVEHETMIGDRDAIAAILSELGFEFVHTVEKTRELYAYSEFLLALDSVSQLGTFLEVEAHGPHRDLDRLRAEALQLVAAVGGDASELIQSSYLELLLEE